MATSRSLSFNIPCVSCLLSFAFHRSKSHLSHFAFHQESRDQGERKVRESPRAIEGTCAGGDIWGRKVQGDFVVTLRKKKPIRSAFIRFIQLGEIGLCLVSKIIYPDLLKQ